MPLTNTALKTSSLRGDHLRSASAGSRLSPDLTGTGHRILFLDLENAAHNGVHRELEEMGHKTAWIGLASEERAGLAR